MQKKELALTPEEKQDFLQLKNKSNESLTRKEKLRLAVYYDLIRKASDSSESVASRENSDLGKTENDYYRKEGANLFKTTEQVNKCRYEYNTVEKTTDQTGNAEFQRKNKMKTILKDTLFKCEMAERILSKRPLTAQEEEEVKTLKLKRDSNRADYDDDVRYDELIKIKINPGEKEVAEFVKGITKCYYYKNANTTLLPGTSFREWNMDITQSPEPSNIIETCHTASHASIGVFFQDPIDFAEKFRKKSNNNVVIVVDASRMGPGGSWERGDEGIEEQIFYRTSISTAVDREISEHFYPLKNESVIYAPKNMVFRQNKATEYKTLEDNKNPDFQSFIFVTGAIVKQTNISGDDVTEDKVDSSDVEIYINKIKNAMAVALFNGHNSILFTAIGCYNHGKDYNDCTDAFLYAIFDPKTMYYRRFKSIIFCVPPDVIPDTVELIDVVEAGSKKQLRGP